MGVDINNDKRELIRIRIADVLALGLDKLYSDAMRLLPYDDCEKISRYARENDRLLCLAGRVMIRALALEATGCSDISLGFSEFGKPYFKSENTPQFNLSHSGNRVALAFGDYPIGVDIEHCKEFEWSEVAEGFSDAERAYIMFGSNRLERFYRVWTIREAISKEEGGGLSSFGSDEVSIDFGRKEAQLNGRKVFFNDWAVSGYALCVCSQQRFETDADFVSSEDWCRMTVLLADAAKIRNN